MSSFRLLSQQVFLVGFGVFELFVFPPCAESMCDDLRKK